jgi:hypothetical protein
LDSHIVLQQVRYLRLKTQLKEIEDEISEKFSTIIAAGEDVEVNPNDGSFFMKFDDWYDRFTSLFVAIKFPTTWIGMRTKGTWNGESGSGLKRI